LLQLDIMTRWHAFQRLTISGMALWFFCETFFAGPSFG
jgi:hypothetical protein